MVEHEGLLDGCRVPDLTDEKELICRKILGDFGADVIKVERPGGDASRNIGPFYKEDADPKKSLFWFATNRLARSSAGGASSMDVEVRPKQKAF